MSLLEQSFPGRTPLQSRRCASSRCTRCRPEGSQVTDSPKTCDPSAGWANSTAALVRRIRLATRSPANPTGATEAPAGTSVVVAPRRARRAATYSSSRAAESTCSGQRQAPAGLVGVVKQSIKTLSVDTPVNGLRAHGRSVASRRDDRPSDLSTAFSWPDESVPAVPHPSRVSRRTDSLSKDFVSRASHSRGASSLGSSVGPGPDR
jgi:hypothetical protein